MNFNKTLTCAALAAGLLGTMTAAQAGPSVCDAVVGNLVSNSSQCLTKPPCTWTSALPSNKVVTASAALAIHQPIG